MVGAALLTAYKNAGGNIELEAVLSEIYSRGNQVPGGACVSGELVVQECICRL